MKLIAITQRVAKEPTYLQGHDMLDPQLSQFLYTCDCLPIIIPNVFEVAKRLTQEIAFDGVLLSGGNVTSERADIENFLIAQAISKQIPLLGVCQGMQRLQQFIGQVLIPVEGHVQAEQTIFVNNKAYQTNSYHDYGVKTAHPDLTIFATHQDGVIKAIKHKQHRLYGLMWHPERQTHFSKQDIAFVKGLYSGEQQCEQSY